MALSGCCIFSPIRCQLVVKPVDNKRETKMQIDNVTSYKKLNTKMRKQNNCRTLKHNMSTKTKLLLLLLLKLKVSHHKTNVDSPSVHTCSVYIHVVTLYRETEYSRNKVSRFVSSLYHYENMPMLYTEICKVVKIENFQ